MTFNLIEAGGRSLAFWLNVILVRIREAGSLP